MGAGLLDCSVRHYQDLIRVLPKRVKRRKQFRGSMAGKALRGNTISNGEYGLVSTEPCWIKSNQIAVSYTHLDVYKRQP